MVSVQDEKVYSGLSGRVAENRESLERALHIVEQAQILRFVRIHFRELYKAEAGEKTVVSHTPFDDAEALSF